MSLRNFIVILVGVLLAAFSVLNWQAMSAPTTISLGLADVQAPLGLIMLGMLLGVVAIAALMVALHQTQWLVDARRMEKDLRHQRELADKAELSRFTRLQEHLDGQLQDIKDQLSQQETRIQDAVTRLQQATQDRVEEEARSLAAQVGELEDRVEQLLPPKLPA